VASADGARGDGDRIVGDDPLLQVVAPNPFLRLVVLYRIRRMNEGTNP
jgi:hypothetical protein